MINTGQNSKKHIVLVGMTGCGKSTVGGYLAAKTGRALIDTDKLITDGEGMTVSEIFTLHGEQKFREIESFYLSRAINDEVPSVISTGGGIVTLAKNRILIKENTFVVWLIRKRDEVIKNPNILNRPPIYGDVQNYDRIYESRKSFYSETACIVLQNEDSKKTADMIIAMI